MLQTEGEFAQQPHAYQRYCDFPQDEAGNLYQTGVFGPAKAGALGTAALPVY